MRRRIITTLALWIFFAGCTILAVRALPDVNRENLPVALFLEGLLAYWLVMREEVHRRQRRVKGLCDGCGYDLSGNVSGVCPECGRWIGVRHSDD